MSSAQSTTRKRHRSSSTPHHPPPLSSFPDDITIELLSRLPVKSLLRFTCVSKPFNSLISSPDFVKLHTRRASTDPSLRNLRLFSKNRLADYPFRLTVPLPSLLDGLSSSLPPSPPPPLPLHIPIFKLRPQAKIVGSCNGIICWIDFYESDIYLHFLNPFTTLSSRSRCFRHPPTHSSFNLYGFGYDHFNETYKAVGIHCDPAAEATLVKVYDVGSPRIWRKVSSFAFVPGRSENAFGVFVSKSNTLNWLWTVAAGDDSRVVFSVNIGSETCQEVSLPDAADINGYQSPRLAVLGGCLCLCYELNSTRFLIWQMKEFGDSKSWTKLFDISFGDVGVLENFNGYLIPFLMLQNGEVLFQLGRRRGRFVLHNPRDNSFECFRVVTGNAWTQCMTHVESLESPCPARRNLRFGGGDSHVKITAVRRNAPTRVGD